MTVRYLRKSASAQDRLAILSVLKRWPTPIFPDDRLLSSCDIAEICDLTPDRASVILYELAEQGHIARRTVRQPNGPGTVSYFQHIPGHQFAVYVSKSKPRPNQKRKPKVSKPLPLETAWRR